VRAARLQREAVAAIQSAGGIAFYNWEFSNGGFVVGGEPSVPAWLVDVIGVDYFGHVTSAYIFPPANDQVIAQVGRLKRLQLLDVSSSSVTDVGLERLRGLTNLSFLSLGQTQVTDAGLVHLKGLSSVKGLLLDGTAVTDAGLDQLKGMTNLEFLGLDSTRVTDAGLVHLEGLPKLSQLFLGSSQVTDAGLTHLKGLKRFSIGLQNERLHQRLPRATSPESRSMVSGSSRSWTMTAYPGTTTTPRTPSSSWRLAGGCSGLRSRRQVSRTISFS
jgi:hypothetical protein